MSYQIGYGGTTAYQNDEAGLSMGPPICTLGYATARSKGNPAFASRGHRSNRAARIDRSKRCTLEQVTKFQEQGATQMSLLRLHEKELGSAKQTYRHLNGLRQLITKPKKGRIQQGKFKREEIVTF